MAARGNREVTNHDDNKTERNTGNPQEVQKQT
jgi:hypothetical protein